MTLFCPASLLFFLLSGVVYVTVSPLSLASTLPVTSGFLVKVEYVTVFPLLPAFLPSPLPCVTGSSLAFLVSEVNSVCLISGSFAGFAAVSITYPFDVIKRKYHLTGEMGNKSYNSYYDIIKTTYKNNGIVGFYRGLFACYSKIIPSSAIFFYTVELCNNVIKKNQ